MKIYSNVIKVMVSIIILVILIRFIDIEFLIQNLKLAKLLYLIPIIILLFLFLLLRAYIFKKIVNKDSKKISFKEAFYLNLITIALNTFLPSATGGIGRSYFGYRRTGLKEEMLSSSIIDLLMAMTSIFILGILFSWIFSLYYTVIFLVLIIIISILILNPNLIPWSIFNKIVKFTSNIELSKTKLISSFSIKNSLKIQLFILSIFAWAINYLGFYLICKMFSIEINPLYIFTIAPLITLARLFPFTFSGLGSKEAVVIYLFGLININTTLALLASLTHFTLHLIPGIFGIPLFFDKKPEFKSSKVKIATGKDHKEWDDFIKNNKGTIYQTSRYKNIIEKTHKYKPYYFYTQDKNITAILPTFLVKSKFFGNKLVSVPHGDKAGPLGNKEAINIILNEINKNHKSLNIDQVEIHNLRIKADYKKPWEYYTFQIDLTRPEKEILSNFSKNIRNAIIKTKRDNLTIEKIHSIQKLKIFYSIYQKNMHILGTPPLSFKLFRSIFLELYPSDFIAYLVKYQNHYVGGSIFLIDNKIARWLFGVSHPKYRNLNPVTLTIWNFIQENHNKVNILDLGVSRPDSGNFEFKKRFNGKQISREWKYKFFNKNLIIDPRSDKLKSSIKIWKKTPQLVANLIGPIIRRSMGR